MSSLISCNIIERDKTGDILWSWTFPCIRDEEKKYLENKCSLKQLKSSIYGKYQNDWFYIYICESDQKILENVEYIGVILWTKDFKPEIYSKLSSLLGNIYKESGDPTEVLQLYLSIATKDIGPSNNNGSLPFKEFFSQPIKNTRIKELIKMFGLEIIMIYNALLLQKRLVVYHHSLPVLLEWLKSFPYFIAHRNMENSFIPWFEVNDQDIMELNSCTNYIAGCCDNAIFSRTELYDVLVNLAAKEISVSPQSKDKLPMTKTHKEIALYMEQIASSDSDEENVVNSINLKTQELISLIRSMSTKDEDGRDYIPMSVFKERNFSPAMENFVGQLVLTENIYIS